MPITYEWVVEQMEGDEIIDTSGFDTLAEAQKFATCPTDIICLRRDVGNADEGLIDRQYAYAGATEFDAGATIPKRLLANFRSLPIC